MKAKVAALWPGRIEIRELELPLSKEEGGSKRKVKAHNEALKG